ncbi:caspase family protein [Streptomyces sp. NRRL S-87]|uniref:caspase family protein n=1 Tax=Streptomyces sp. NRRL S-87 TaxID=1463920 RepID=UPI0004BE916E|nr:caspase family protein [Streptomyces sp. NRRL S-87]
MRYLVAAGTRRYRDAALPELPAVPGDVAAVVSLFGSMGYERVLAEVSDDPGAGDLEDALADWCASAALSAEDVVVVYYAGHGERPPAGGYRLACADTGYGRPHSWLSPADLAEVLATSPVRHVLFVVDACYAAVAGTGIGTVSDAVAAGRARTDATGSGTWLLASARHRDLADDGAFVSRLADAVAAGDGASQRYLAPGTLADRVNRAFTAAGRRQRATCYAVDQSEAPPFFANPLHDPRAEHAGDGARGADAGDLAAHFEPRGRGVEQVHDPGSYFTGRERALREARAHLAGEGAAGALVVTADPGSGKSAVLGRLVLEGHADASVNAHHQTLDALVGRLAAAADVHAATPSALFEALAGRRRPLRIVVDSLDEAGPGGDRAEARRIAWDLLRPLAGVPCVRLLVGSRRELLPHLGDRVPLIDLDEGTYADDTDTAEYVEKVISDTGAPYADLPDLARRVAAEVARRAGRCFLVARMTASALLRGRPADTSVPGWAEQLPSDVGGAFEAYLRRRPAGRRTATTALLTALAFAEGSGLPRRLWVRVAGRLSGLPLTETDVDLLLEEDGSYVAHASVDRTRSFRLYHQELTDHMRARVLRHRDAADVQQCFVDVLRELVPEGDWSAAPAYVRSHLATHAAGSGALDDLIEDAAFVLAADPATLLPAVRQVERRPVPALAVERFGSLLDGADPDTDRAALLAFVAETHGVHGLARAAEGLSGTVRRIAAQPRRFTPHRVVGRHAGDVYSMRSVFGGWRLEPLVLPSGGRAVVAQPPLEGQVNVWFLDDPAQSTVLPHADRVVGLAVLADRAEAVTLDRKGALRVWGVADQSVRAVAPATGLHALDGGGLLSDGTPVAVCRDKDRAVALSLPGLDVLAEHRTEKNGRAGADSLTARLGCDEAGRAVMFVFDRGRGVLTAHDLERSGTPRQVLAGLAGGALLDGVGGPRGTVLAFVEWPGHYTVFEPATGRSTSTPREKSLPWASAGGFAHGSGADPVFVVSNSECFLGVRLGGLVRGAALMHLRTALVDAVLVDGELFVVGAATSADVVLTECATGAPAGTLYGHEGAVSAVRVLDAPGAAGPDVLAVGNDGTARLWRWGAHAEGGPPGPAAGEERMPAQPEVGSLTALTGETLSVVAGGSRTVWRATYVPGEGGTARVAVGPATEFALGDDSDTVRSHEDPDGTLNLLDRRVASRSFVESGGGPPDPNGPVCETTVSSTWRRLRAGADLPAWSWLGGNESGLQAWFLPGTDRHPATRVLEFDALRGRATLVTGADGARNVVDLPWTVAVDADVVRVTAFTTAAGDAVLMTATRAARGDESSVGGYRRDRLGRPSTGRGQVVAGRLWDAATGLQYADGAYELAHDVDLLVPHRGRAGTRWIAQRGLDTATSVIDLVTGARHPVSPPAPDAGRERGRGPDFLRWADLGEGPPMLLCLVGPLPDTVDTVPSQAPVPVAVWHAADPEVTGRLPVLAHRILWTGHAPSGEALVAVSDGTGVVLCHLPSGEQVWAAPVPALVTALVPLPGSAGLDLAVGTQQGVVFVRPRLSARWRQRLGAE